MNNLANIKRASVEDVLANLRNPSAGESRIAGELLVSQARDAGLSMRDYLTLAIDVTQTKDDNLKAAAMAGKLNGYDLSKAYLKLPVNDDFEQGVLLQAAADSFQTFPGTRALFPEVVDDMVSFKFRQETFERVEPLLVQSRTINGTELVSMVIDDKPDDYDVWGEIAEGANIPVSAIRTTQQSVGIFKHGMGYRTTYEFERRASLDLLTPYANRAQRQLERSRVRFATNLLINGHALNSGVNATYGAAPEVTQTSFDAGAVNGTLSWRGLLGWLTARARSGTPIDTVVGNYDAYLQWVLLFAIPGAAGGASPAETLGRAGFQLGGVPILTGVVNFVLSSFAPANKLIGFSRADTIEELVESGSLINESDRSVRNQTISYFRTLNSGYRLVHGDTRSVYNFGG